MSWDQATAFARSIGYADVRTGADANVLLAEGEKCTTPDDCRGKRPRLVFEYSRANDDKPPTCISVMQGGPLDWKHVLVEYTGADTTKLRSPKRKSNGMVDDEMTVASAVGQIKVLVDGDGVVFSVYAGPNCEK